MLANPWARAAMAVAIGLTVGLANDRQAVRATLRLFLVSAARRLLDEAVAHVPVRAGAR